MKGERSRAKPPRRLSRWLLPALTLALAGCITDFNAMKADINDLKQDNFRLKKDIAELKGNTASIKKDAAALKARAGKLPAKDSLAALRESQTSLYSQVSDTLREMQALSGRFEESKYSVEKELKRLSADMEVLRSRLDGIAAADEVPELVDIKSRLDGMEGDIAFLKAKLAAREAMPRKKKPAGIKASPGDMYDDAYKAFEARQYAEARKKMRALIGAYPDHPLAGNAWFWVGETYYNESGYENAILSYEEVIQKHEGHHKVPDAMLKQAYAFIEIRDKKTAAGILKLLMDRFPKSGMARKAKQKLGTLK